MARSAFIRIDYDEFQPGTYRSVRVESMTQVVMRWDSGDPVKDWADMSRWLAKESWRYDNVMNTSSVDHFIMDNEEYSFLGGHLVRNGRTPA